jgi:predicted aspartyl protease
MSGTGLAMAGGLAPMLLWNVAVPAIHSSNGAQEAGEVEIIAGRADAVDRLTVPVKIGASGPYRFLVDTGSQNTVVSSALAADLALPAGPSARVVGVAGEQRVGTVEIDEIFLGRRSAYSLRAPLLERTHIGADGILGIDSLQGQRVLFDFTKNVIAVQEARKVGNSGYEIIVRGRRRGDQLLITEAYIDGIRTNVVIDTGADASIGNRALQRALSRRMKREQTTLTSVTGQEMIADIGIARQLSVGDLNVSNIMIAFADSPAFDTLDLEKKPALLLGMRELRAFNRVAIDFSTWKVLFDLRGI